MRIPGRNSGKRDIAEGRVGGVPINVGTGGTESGTPVEIVGSVDRQDAARAPSKWQLLWRLPRHVDATVDAVLAITLAIQLGIVAANITGRACCQRSLPWLDEASQLLMLTLIAVGGAISYRRGYHSSLRWLVARLPGPVEPAVVAFAELCVLFTAVGVAAASVPILFQDWGERTPALRVPVTIILLPLPVGAAVLAGYSAAKLKRMALRPLIVGAASIASLGLILSLLATYVDPIDNQVAILAVLAAVFGLELVAGTPITIVLVNIPLLYLLITGTGPPGTVPLLMFDHSGNFVLVAIPFFVLAGIVMAHGGLGSRIGNLVRLLLGRIPGGPLQALIVSMFIFSGLSGSKSADLAAVGTAMSDSVAAQGYRRGEIGAVLGASAVMGETIPPCVAMIVFASISSVSTASLFLAGVVPAAVVACCLAIFAYLSARGRTDLLPVDGVTQRAVGLAVWRAVPALIVPVVLVGGILLAIATPTEVSVIAVFCAFAIVALTSRAWRGQSLEVLRTTTGISGMVMFTISGATAFAWFLTVTQAPQQLASLVTSIGSPRLFMLATIAVAIVLGVLLEGLPALIILAPVLTPIAGRVGIDPLQYAIVLILAQGIGTMIPPVGMGAYVISAILRTSVEELIRPLLKYLVVLVVGLLIVAAVPQFSTWLPRLLRP